MSARQKFESVNPFSVLETWEEDLPPEPGPGEECDIHSVCDHIRRSSERRNLRMHKSGRKAPIPVEISIDYDLNQSVLDDFFDVRQKSADRWLKNNRRSGRKRSGISWPDHGKKFTDTYRCIHDALRKNIAFRRNRSLQLARRNKLKLIRAKLWKEKHTNIGIKRALLSNVFQLGCAIPQYVLKYMSFIGGELFQLRSIPSNRTTNWLLRRAGVVNSTLTNIEFLDFMAFRL